MAERKLLAQYEVRVKVMTKNLSEEQKRIIGNHAGQLMTTALEEQNLEGSNEFMDLKPGQIIVKDWKFLDLKPTPDAQRKLFAENGAPEKPDPEL